MTPSSRSPHSHRVAAHAYPLALVALILSACCTAAPTSTTSAGDAPPQEIVSPDPHGHHGPTAGEPTETTPRKAPDEALIARCSAPIDYTKLSREEAEAWRAECKPAFDCTEPLPPKACCLAMTPDCLRCADEGKATRAAFDYACFGETSPMPETADCSAPPPLSACCKALLPKCLDCVAKNRYLSELHRRQCGE